MDKQLIERIAKEVAGSLSAPYVSDASLVRFAAEFLARVDAEQSAEIERLRESNRRLNHRCQDAESAAQAKVQEAEKVGGYFLGSANQFLINGYRAEVERLTTLSSQSNQDHLNARLDSQRTIAQQAERIAEQAALIEKCEKALQILLPVAQRFERQASKGTGGRRCGPVFEKARAALAAIAAQKGGAE